MKNIAIIIFAIGVLLTVYTSFNLVTREKVVDIGKVEITADKNNYFAWSPILGIALMTLGGGLFFFGTKKS
jgi:hypothetical protein